MPTSTPAAPAQETARRMSKDDLRREHRYLAGVFQNLRNWACGLCLQFPGDRNARLYWADILRMHGELDAARKEYQALLAEAGPIERRYIEELIDQCHPDRRYWPPAFQNFIETVPLGRPEHREHLCNDLARGRELAFVLQQFCPLAGSRILEVGCSLGGAMIALAERGAVVVGIEFDVPRSQEGLRRIRDLGFDLEWHTGDICDPVLTQRLGEFDLILCENILEHVMDPDAAIRHMCSMLRPGGIVYFSVPNKYAPDFILADHHWGLMGLSLLSRPQALVHFQHATGFPAESYLVGYLRTEKYYRNAFARGSVKLELTERYGVNQVIWYATSIAKLAARLDKEICPGLPAKLQDRIRRRAWKVVKLYTHATEVLRSMAGSPVQQAAACDLLVRRIGHSAWRFVGTKT